MDDGSEDKKVKDTKNCLMKRKLKFENYRNFLGATQVDNKIRYLEKKIMINSLKRTMRNL